MGTRHITAVMYKNAYAVAQYGQFDGYPGCAGLEVLAFAKKLNKKKHRKAFLDCLQRTKFITRADLQGMASTKILEQYPMLDRDVGSGVLEMMLKTEGDIHLMNQIAFAGESVFCEWAYVIDLDLGTFEVYEGFNTSPLSKDDRFYGFETEGNAHRTDHKVYYPVKLLRSYDLEDLPRKRTFLKECKSSRFE